MRITQGFLLTALIFSSFTTPRAQDVDPDTEAALSWLCFARADCPMWCACVGDLSDKAARIRR